MKHLILLITILLSLNSYAQITGTAEYRYFYNSEILFYETKQSPYGFDYEEKTVANQHANTLVGVAINIPFNIFEESPIYSNKFSLDAKYSVQADHVVNRFVQQFYNFSLNYRLLNNEDVYLTTSTFISEIFNNPKRTVIDGNNFKIGLNYNVVNQKFPNIVNFYASVDYLVFSKFHTLLPYGNHFNATNNIDNVIGIVLNIKDFIYFEQNFHTITESNLPSLTFSPYYSDYTTKFWISYKQFNLCYEHTCFHPIESDNDNPKISGVLNSVFLEFNF